MATNNPKKRHISHNMTANLLAHKSGEEWSDFMVLNQYRTLNSVLIKEILFSISYLTVFHHMLNKL